jgi:hypothetical protein
LAKIDVPATFLRPEELDFDFSFLIAPANVCNKNTELVEHKHWLASFVVVCFDFRLVDWLPDGVFADASVLAVNQEKEHLSSLLVVVECQPRHENHLVIVLNPLDLFSGDLDSCVSLCLRDWFNQYLIFGCHYLMQRKNKFSDLIVSVPIVKILEVVDVVNDDLELLLLLELVGHVKAFHPFGVEVVHYDLCLADHLPHVSSFLVQHCHAVCPCKCI